MEDKYWEELEEAENRRQVFLNSLSPLERCIERTKESFFGHLFDFESGLFLHSNATNDYFDSKPLEEIITLINELIFESENLVLSIVGYDPVMNVSFFRISSE